MRIRVVPDPSKELTVTIPPPIQPPAQPDGAPAYPGGPTPPQGTYPQASAYGQAGPYNPTIYGPPAPWESLGAWLGILLIGAIPLIGFFALLYMAFSSSVPSLAVRNYARAQLIFTAVAGGLALLGFLAILGLGLVGASGSY